MGIKPPDGNYQFVAEPPGYPYDISAEIDGTTLEALFGVLTYVDPPGVFDNGNNITIECVNYDPATKSGDFVAVSGTPPNQRTHTGTYTAI